MDFMPTFFGLSDAQKKEEDPAAVLARSTALDAADATLKPKKKVVVH